MAQRRAALPMYDFPEIRTATDAFWSALGDHLRQEGMPDVPHALSTPHDLAPFWSDPDMLLAQTCGYPLTHNLCGDAQLVATPHYAVPDADGVHYGSAIIVARESGIQTVLDAKGKRAAINGRDSNTGMNLFRITLARAGARGIFFDSVIETGAHRASVKAVLQNKADIASIDVVSLAHLKRIQPQISQRLRIVAMTPKTPGLPFITGARSGAATLRSLRDGLSTVIHKRLRSDNLNTLLLKDMTVLDRADYDVITAFEEEAAALGYPALL